MGHRGDLARIHLARKAMIRGKRQRKWGYPLCDFGATV
jgi:hypothetical protein